MVKRKLSFKQLESRVFHEYRKKGFSISRARGIAKATAGKVFWGKFGKRRGAAIIRRSRR
jgi:hypothetical protein